VIAFASAPDAEAAFDTLPPSHQREWADFVDDAVRPETRERRAARCVDNLRGDR